jgi:hypothetical protein
MITDYTEHFCLDKICVCLFLFCSTHLILKNIINELAIWYLIHFLGNMYIVLISLTPIFEILSDPLYQLFHPIEYYDTTIIADLIHIYHILFFNLTNDDIFHHLFFVGLGSFTVYYFQSGYYSALTHFFICGLPGGIDYLFLFFYKIGYIEKITRLKAAMFLNVWIRSPGLCMLATVSIIKFIYTEKTYINTIELILQILNTLVNGQYYMQDVVYANGKYEIKYNY